MTSLDATLVLTSKRLCVVLLQAQLCRNEDCTVRMHLYCEELKFARRQVCW